MSMTDFDVPNIHRLNLTPKEEEETGETA